MSLQSEYALKPMPRYQWLAKMQWLRQQRSKYSYTFNSVKHSKAVESSTFVYTDILHNTLPPVDIYIKRSLGDGT